MAHGILLLNQVPPRASAVSSHTVTVAGRGQLSREPWIGIAGEMTQVGATRPHITLVGEANVAQAAVTAIGYAAEVSLQHRARITTEMTLPDLARLRTALAGEANAAHLIEAAFPEEV
ncbi:MAG: hypothetical protein ACRD4P_05135 [Bryobacteraceae bacterium]